jgi:general secretion pathway protein D
LRNHSANLPKALLDAAIGNEGLGVIFKGNYMDMVVNALAQDSQLTIVSRPKMLILNNETGNINVGTQVPVVTSEVSAADTPQGSINRNISYRTTGVTLGVTPTVNSQGVVTMKIAINLSEAQINDTSNIDSPMIVNRTLGTVAVVHSGDTILIGGLISSNYSQGDSGVPWIKDTPVLGTLFKTQSDKVKKTELIMLIRPTIIHSAAHMRAETRKFKALLKHLEWLY